jgi:hypothetical protein
MQRLVGAAVRRWDEIVEEVFLHGGDRGGGKGLAPGRGGDDGEELEFCDGGAGDVDSLGVGASVGWGEVEAVVLDQVVGESDVDGGEAFEEVATAKGHAEPETFGARFGEEGAPGEALGVGVVVEVEFADVADVLDVVEKKRGDAAGEVEEVDCAVSDEG